MKSFVTIKCQLIQIYWIMLCAYFSIRPKLIEYNVDPSSLYIIMYWMS